MIFLGFRLDNILKNEIENSLEYELTSTETVIEFLDNVKTKRFDAIIIEEKNHKEEGLINLITKAVEYQKKSVVIILGETSNLNIVVGSLKAGAYDYILKPISAKEIIKIINKSVNDKKTAAEKIDKNKNTGDKLIGHSKEMLEVYKKIGKVSKSMLPVLIVGENGCGKTSVATAIHQFSDNKKEPFLAINCLALGSELIERKLFGYEKGAFKGAVISQIGDLEKISNGTLHLGNIESLSLELQSKILYFIEQGEFFRIGSPVPIKSNVRIIASTTKNLNEKIIKEQFIEELYLKLKVLEINIPALRERKEDIPLILDHYIKQCNQELDANVKGISKPALKKLLRYDWPGNVNELKNSIKSAIAISRGSTIVLDDLPNNLLGTSMNLCDNQTKSLSLKEWVNSEITALKKNNKFEYYDEIISKVEKELIKQILETTNGKKVETAEFLGITRNTLRTKMQKYDLE
ncbi:MAG: sigma-54-dependent transcriptional regulator [Fusobacteriaceae bacterium]